MQARTWGKCSVCRPPTTQLDPDLPEGRPLFKHSRGNSWHDVDSTLVLLVFCHLQLATGLALGALAFYCLRSRALAGALAGGSLAVRPPVENAPPCPLMSRRTPSSSLGSLLWPRTRASGLSKVS